jgi:hypothetical protein
MKKITRQEVEQKMREKLQAINTLCKQLEIVIEAAQKIDEQGFLRTVVTYTDVEKYDIAPAEFPKEDVVAEKVEESKTETPNEN